jgi:hypothetical protein
MATLFVNVEVAAIAFVARVTRKNQRGRIGNEMAAVHHQEIRLLSRPRRIDFFSILQREQPDPGG